MKAPLLPASCLLHIDLTPPCGSCRIAWLALPACLPQEDNLSRNANSRSQALVHLRQEVTTLTSQVPLATHPHSRRPRPGSLSSVGVVPPQVSELEARKQAAEEETEQLARSIQDKEAEATRVNGKKTESEHQLLDLQVRTP